MAQRPPRGGPLSGPYLDELFASLIARPPGAREDELERWRRVDPALADELGALLRADGAHPPPPAPLEEGQELDRFRLVRRLGAGASASVWQAWDTHLRTWTALKVLSARPGQRASHDALEAVLHEARAASRIISDHVVRVREAGRLPDGRCFIDMQLCAEYRPDLDGAEELVLGASLADVGPLAPVEAARLVAEAARGVEAAHRVGVLHRDLKPANLLRQPVSGRVLVTDFGLAAARLPPAAGPSTPATASVSVLTDGPEGIVVGTPAWMAPEQAMGRTPTRASDVYALGATLYTLLAGRPPYASGAPTPAKALEVLQLVREGPPPPCPAPPRLARLLDRAMHRDPAQRYATAAELARDLERYAADRVTSVDRPSPLLPVWLAARRNQEVSVALLVLALALLASAASLWTLDRRRQELLQDVAEAAARRQAAEALAEAAERVRADEERARAEAERAREEAERGRAQAQIEREVAEADRRAALEARAAAELGQTEAERLAARQIRAREEAARQRALSEAGRQDAERRLTDLQDRVESLMTRVEAAEGRLGREYAARIALEAELERLRAPPPPPPPAPAPAPPSGPAPAPGAAPRSSTEESPVP
jgi:serine/threonine protein kinase